MSTTRPSTGFAIDTAPIVRSVSPVPDPAEIFQRVAHRPGCVFLDSSQRHQRLGRYSFLATDPFETWQYSARDIKPDSLDSQPAMLDSATIDSMLSAGASQVVDLGLLANLTAALDRFETDSIPNLPPFQGGLAGLFSYDLNRTFERIAPAAYDEFQLPILSIGAYDLVMAWDHQDERCWIISQGWPETEPAARRRRAQRRLEQWLGCWDQSPAPANGLAVDRLSADDLAPQVSVEMGDLTSNFSRTQYLSAVRSAIESIRAGDIFQVNLSQRLLHPATRPGAELYAELRRHNPAPFAGYYRGSGFEILSCSPERFVRLQGRDVETRPIKGTRRRSGYPESDLLAAGELLKNDKDRSENIMIVDLLRNDLSRCCLPESILVEQLCQLESYASVLHLVSAIRGKLAADAGPLQLLASVFPGGSITGAPKVRAMEIISQLEPTARGPYCGSLGYIGFNGQADLNILIRTVTAAQGWWQLPVGGGIVSLSDPAQEYDETWAKASGMLKAVLNESR